MAEIQEAVTSPTSSDAPPIVSRDPRIFSGALIAYGSRLPVAYIVSYGDTPEGHRRAQRNYPWLTLEQVEEVFAYMRAHPDLDPWS